MECGSYVVLDTNLGEFKLDSNHLWHLSLMTRDGSMSKILATCGTKQVGPLSDTLTTSGVPPMGYSDMHNQPLNVCKKGIVGIPLTTQLKKLNYPTIH